MYCPLNYRRAQPAHGIHLYQKWSKVGSRDLLGAPDSAGGVLSESFIYLRFKFAELGLTWRSNLSNRPVLVEDLKEHKSHFCFVLKTHHQSH